MKASGAGCEIGNNRKQSESDEGAQDSRTLKLVSFTWRGTLSGVELIAMGVPDGRQPTSAKGHPPNAMTNMRRRSHSCYRRAKLAIPKATDELPPTLSPCEPKRLASTPSLGGGFTRLRYSRGEIANMKEPRQTDRLRYPLSAEREDLAFHRKILRRMGKPGKAPIWPPLTRYPDKHDLHAEQPRPGKTHHDLTLTAGENWRALSTEADGS